MTELIISEKPSAAKRIAESLAEGKPIKVTEKKIPYYKITRGKQDIIVASAVGHLYGLKEKGKNNWDYPKFNVEWKPAHENNKKSDFSKAYLQLMKKLAKEAEEFTVATDYDTEGEVIGLNIVRFLCKKKDANRMRFSTLTKEDLVKSYEKKSKTLNWGQANAGETRHFLDWYYGINTSRALTTSIKTAGGFKVMSAGRVQAPALKIIVDKENEISKFKPKKYWEIQLLGSAKSKDIEAWHEKGKFDEKKQAQLVIEKTKVEKTGKVSDIKKKETQHVAPAPFDLTTLQIEAYRCFRISPKETLSIAQDLYTSGLISYPRTSSQKLPEELGLKKLISNFLSFKKYKEFAEEILKNKALRPNEGKKTDPAHPAIFPTGAKATLTDRKEKIYDLIVRRFLSTFGTPALRETVSVKINIKEEIFISKGTRTKEQGWYKIYGPYVKLEEKEIPNLSKNDEIKIKEINLIEKETTPPRRYTPASLIKELEKRNLGTKSTRAQIIDTLFDRGYVKDTSIKASHLGKAVIDVIEKHVPKMIDEELTRHFEIEMEEIRENKKTSQEVLDEAKKILIELLDKFKKDEEEIGKDLRAANVQAIKEETTVGKCPCCKDGTLVIKRGKFGRFIACNKHPDCNATFSLPANALVKVSDKVCEHCNHPMILVIKKRKAPQNICINKECPSKAVDEKKLKDIICPRCGKGKMKVRKSVYGAFLGCEFYPECRTIMRIDEEGNPVPIKSLMQGKKGKSNIKKKSIQRKGKK